MATGSPFHRRARALGQSGDVVACQKFNLKRRTGREPNEHSRAFGVIYAQDKVDKISGWYHKREVLAGAATIEGRNTECMGCVGCYCGQDDSFLILS